MSLRQASLLRGLFPLACYFLFLLDRPLNASPPALKVGLAFLVLFVLPGWLFCRLALPARPSRFYELIPLSFCVSVLMVCGSILAAGFAGSGLRSSYHVVVWLLLLYITLTSFLLWSRGGAVRESAGGVRDEGPLSGSAEIVLLVLVLGAAAVSFWLKDPGSAGGESWIHMKRVNAILLTDSVFPAEGTMGAPVAEAAAPPQEIGPVHRVSYLVTALLSLASGVHPVSIFMNSPGIYAPLLVLSFFAFALACLRRPWAALAAALVMSTWVPGLFERASWPQHGAAVLLYTAFWLLLRYLEERRALVLVLCVFIGMFAGTAHSSYFLRWYFTVGAFVLTGLVFLRQRRAMAMVLGATALTLLVALPYNSLQAPVGKWRAAVERAALVRPPLEEHLSEGTAGIPGRVASPLYPGARAPAARPGVLTSPIGLVPLAFVLVLLLRRGKGLAEVFMTCVILGPVAVFLMYWLLGSLGGRVQGEHALQLWQADVIYPLICSYAVFLLPGALRSLWLRCGAALLAVFAVALFVAPIVRANLEGYRVSLGERFSPSPYHWREGYAFLDTISSPAVILTDALTAEAMPALTRHRAMSFDALDRILTGDMAGGLGEGSQRALAVLIPEGGIARTIAIFVGHAVDYLVLNFDFLGAEARTQVMESLDGHPDALPKVYERGSWVVFRVVASEKSLRARATELYASAWQAARAGEWARLAEEFQGVLLLDPLNLGGEVRIEPEPEGAILFATYNPTSQKGERMAYLLGAAYVANMKECRRVLDPTADREEVERLVGELGISHIVLMRQRFPAAGRSASWPSANFSLNPARFEVDYTDDSLVVYRVLGDDRERALTHLVDAFAALARGDAVTAQVEAARARELRPGDPAVLEGASEISQRVGWHARQAALRAEDALEDGRSEVALGLLEQALHLGERDPQVLRRFFSALEGTAEGGGILLAGWRCQEDACGPAVDGRVLGSEAREELGSDGVGFVDVDLGRRRFLKDVWVTTYMMPGELGEGLVHAVSIATSLDGTWWSPAGSLRGWAMQGEGMYTFLVEDIYRYARHLRVVMEGGVGARLRVDEVDVWEYARPADAIREDMWMDFRGPSIRLGNILAAYEAEALGHTVGVEKPDPAASAGAAVTVSRGEKGYLISGPNERFPAGSYRVTFRLRADDPPPSAQVAVLEAASTSAQAVHRRVELFGEDFPTRRAYSDFSLAFNLPEAAGLEFRLYAAGGAPVWADGVRVDGALDSFVLVEEGRAQRFVAKRAGPAGVASYEAELYPAGVGRARCDEEAYGGVALQASVRRDHAGQLLAMSSKLEAGRYDAAFRLKLARRASSEEVAVLSVVEEDGSAVLASRALHGRDFADKLAYQFFSLPFVIEQEKTLQYRVTFGDLVDMWVDSLVVRRLPAPGGSP